jgi:hypothetical protein
MRWPDRRTLSFGVPLAFLLMASGGVAVPAPLPSNAPTLPEPAINQKIDLPVPIGEPVKGIKIPQYDEEGKMTFCLTAETAKKLDDHQVELGQLKVQFNEKEDKEIVVEIPHSILNLDTKILSADSETVIHRQDFEIVGQHAIFDTLSREGSFKGHVHASFLNGAPVDITTKP